MSIQIFKHGAFDCSVSPFSLEPTQKFSGRRRIYKVNGGLVVRIFGPGYSERIDVPDGFQTDLGSVPSWLSPIMGMPDSVITASICHDMACRKNWPRWKCHSLLRSLMILTGKPSWKARAWWLAVYFFGPQSLFSRVVERVRK